MAQTYTNHRTCVHIKNQNLNALEKFQNSNNMIPNFTRRLVEEGRIHASAAATKAWSVGLVVPRQRPRTHAQADSSLVRQFATKYGHYHDWIVSLLGVQYPDTLMKTKGSIIDDAISIDIHAVVCAESPLI